MIEPDAPERTVEPAHPGTATAGPLSYAVFSLARAHRAFAAQLLRELGLHPGQELLLMQLLDRDDQPQSQLVDSVGLDHSTVSKSLRRMQEAGLLVRKPAEHDGRALVVSLTDQGRAMRGPLSTMWAELERVSSRAPDDAAVRTFIDTARAIQAAVARRGQPFATPAAPPDTPSETGGRTRRPPRSPHRPPGRPRGRPTEGSHQ